MDEPEQQPLEIPSEPGRRRIRTRNSALNLNSNINIQFIPIVSPPPADVFLRPIPPNRSTSQQSSPQHQMAVRDFRVLIEPISMLNNAISNSNNQFNDEQENLDGDIVFLPDSPEQQRNLNQDIEIGDNTSENQNAIEILNRNALENNYNIDPEVNLITNDGNMITNNSENQRELSEPITPTNSGKKRKRSISKTPKRSPTISSLNDDDDDGTICPICLDHWEMSGAHRLTSLKCGHLFGDTCIRRWLAECPSGTKCCPSCKTRVVNRDLRYIYAKRIRAVDNTEEVRLKESLENEKTKFLKLQTDYELMAFELKSVKSQVIKLQNDLEIVRRITSFGGPSTVSELNNTEKYKKFSYYHKMFMSKNIEISKEPGCRVMIYSKFGKNLMVSQKSSQNLFPGYGLKFIDVNHNFRPSTFLYTSLKTLRDLSLNMTEDLVVCASMEKSAKIFDINSRTTVATFTPSDKCIWSCAMDREQRSNFLYLGSQHGSTYIYDIRNSSNIVEETTVSGDQSPVINISAITISDNFPLGGFLVCKLQSLWFYEFLPSQTITATRLAVDGPFMSMNYDNESGNILISTKPSNKFPMSKYILGKIIKLNDIITLDIEMSLFGSKTTQVMSRCTQVPVKDNSLVAAYIQDAKQLTLWNVGESTKIQSLQCTDTVFDTCPIISLDKIYVAALTEMKCRIYEVVSTPKY